MDSKVYENAIFNGLDISEGKYYLSDTGFPSCDQLLIPYHAVHITWPNWVAPTLGMFPDLLLIHIVYIAYRPTNKKKLFNL